MARWHVTVDFYVEGDDPSSAADRLNDFLGRAYEAVASDGIYNEDMIVDNVPEEDEDDPDLPVD